MTKQIKEIQVILFDLGGVLVELPGNPLQPHWFKDDHFSLQDFWHAWLNSPAVHALDQGKVAPLDFANALIDELNMQVCPHELIDTFIKWPKDFFPGAQELLIHLSKNYTIGIYSNITELHWPKFYDTMQQHNAVSHYFASYQIGMSKPYADGYQYVSERMQVPAQKILFLDDNIINVEGARKCGYHAEVTKGLNEVRDVLTLYNINHTA